MSEEPQGSLIGSYTPPEKEVPGAKEEEQEARPSPAKSMAQGIQEDLSNDVKANEDTVEKSKSYEEILEGADISLDEAKAIVDDMLTLGYYTERVPVTKSISVGFRTRVHADYLRLHNALEALNPKFEEEQNEIMLRYCLAGSLARFKDVEFDFPDREKASHESLTKAFDVRLDWIEKQPERLIALLATKLNTFDSKIALVMSEGVIENF